MFHTILDSPIDPLLLASDGDSLTCLYMDTSNGEFPIPESSRRDDDHPVLKLAADQLRAYFAGDIQEFDLPLNAKGTEFQRHVWEELVRIPYGETISYGEMARRVGDPGACRAVGAANGRNPISIVVPCHRVIGANGSLTGFGGGLPRKAKLLGFERAIRFGESAATYWRP
jgi:methylated-DNA-[protein]-cysteine S-methyltransferase